MLTRRAALMGAAGIAALPILAKAETTTVHEGAAPADLSSLQRSSNLK